MSITARRSARRRGISAWGFVFTVAVLVAAIRTWPLYSALLAGLMMLGAVMWAVRRGQRRWLTRHTAGDLPISLAGYQAATPTGFEGYVADLYERDGCSNVTVVGGANDRAADVLATYPNGQRGLTQCKRYAPSKHVGADTVYAVNGTYRDWHGCDRATIVTTSAFTPSAREFADRVGITLVDGASLERWANGTSRPPWM